ncbi:PepSY domain-containing protein [Jiulongibacter sediminis]|uniref:PepSY domain-containing protein n=1 Tax=Jiulongibacter sediminis TaxID=1605367 RepID=UPI0026EC02DF|nr:PepSY domain-containing protein [Jiulongibacter sediminis]
MKGKGWRKLHYLLAAVAGFFILLASGTGLILSIEPFVLHQYAVSGEIDKNLKFNEFQNKLQENFLEVFSLEKDAYGNIKVEGIGLEADGTFFLSANSGEIVEAPQPVATVFNFSRDLHRSLFLKTPGRVLMGITSFAMLFLAISGIALWLKRAGGLRGVLKSIPIIEFNRDRHAYWGRLFILPIIFIAASGLYLSIDRFAELGNESITSTKVGPPLSDITLRDVDAVVFPVLEEEPLIIETKSGAAHYVNGELLEFYPKATSTNLQNWSFMVHTGEGSRPIALILGLSSLVLLFLTYSGFRILPSAFRKRGNSRKGIENKDLVIAVGSETGHTWRFAESLSMSLSACDIDHALIGMDQLKNCKGEKTILFLTSTYGDGEAPENAEDFESKIQDIFAETERLDFGVLGFGSTDYPAYCAYAKELRNQLLSIKNSREVMPYETVNNRSVSDFIEWVKGLNKSMNYQLKIDTEELKPERRKQLSSFEILDKKETTELVFLRIGLDKSSYVRSGDLLAVYPLHENIERYYSIAIDPETEDMILLVKPTGHCSNYLASLSAGDKFEAFVKRNPSFYKPEGSVLMITNGTGIAPFLGMLTPSDSLFWGCRYRRQHDLIHSFLENQNVNITYSKEASKAHVQDLLSEEKNMIEKVLKSNGSIMICGSLSMLKGTTEVLNQIFTESGLPDIRELKKQGRILIDCY